MKKSIKSVATLLLVLLTFVAFSVNAAATSVTTTTEVVGVDRTLEAAANGQVLGARRGTSVSNVVITERITIKAAVNELSKIEKVETIINDYVEKIERSTNNKTTERISANDLTILDSMDIKPAAGVELSEEQPLYVSFSFPGIVKGTKAYVLHYVNNIWEVVPTTVSDGVITAKFTSLSPIAIVVEKSTLKSNVLGASRAVSPRTGDYRYMYIIVGAVVLAVLGLGLGKKVKNA